MIKMLRRPLCIILSREIEAKAPLSSQNLKILKIEFVPCKIPQNKMETIPVRPRVSASKNEHQDIRKNNAVSIVAFPSNRIN